MPAHDTHQVSKMKDHTGRRFGMLTAVRVDRSGKVPAWVCRCDCGNEMKIVPGDLLRRKDPSCGCLEKGKVKVGFRSGRLEVVGEADPLIYANGSKSRVFKCKCDCGESSEHRHSALLSGIAKSCGCLHKETSSENGKKCRKWKHSDTNNRDVYHIWSGMIARCHGDRPDATKNYKAIGRLVCVGWRDFDKFFEDFGSSRPSREFSIDRIDNEGSYTCGGCSECLSKGWPMNCRWATREVQANNTRVTVHLTHNGETKTLSEWSRHLNIPVNTIRGRLYKYGFSVSDALSTPVKPRSCRGV